MKKLDKKEVYEGRMAECAYPFHGNGVRQVFEQGEMAASNSYDPACRKQF